MEARKEVWRVWGDTRQRQHRRKPTARGRWAMRDVHRRHARHRHLRPQHQKTYTRSDTPTYRESSAMSVNSGVCSAWLFVLLARTRQCRRANGR